MKNKTKHPYIEEIDSGLHCKDGKIFVCTCGSEALVVEVEPDVSFGDGVCEGEVYISMWRNYSESYDWKYKLRCIWHILRNGHPFTDSICLTKEQLRKIKKLFRSIKIK